MRPSSNMRIYKKQAKWARGVLLSEFRMSPRDFYITKRDDEFGYALFGKHDSPDPLPGTPIYIPDREYGEHEAQCCVYIVRECIFWDTVGPALARREIAQNS